MIPKSIQFTGDHTRVMKLHLDVKERKRERELRVQEPHFHPTYRKMHSKSGQKYLDFKFVESFSDCEFKDLDS